MDINNQIMNFCSDIISESNLFTKKLYQKRLCYWMSNYAMYKKDFRLF